MTERALKLFAPPLYWTQPDHRNGVGGCGPGAWGDWFVPDRIWFVSIRPACRIHDWMYAVGETLSDKEEADRVFLNNMLRIIDHNTFLKTLNPLRRLRAKTYYGAVRLFGGPAFWNDKNHPAEYQSA